MIPSGVGGRGSGIQRGALNPAEDELGPASWIRSYSLSERENEQGNDRRHMDFLRLTTNQVSSDYCAVAGPDLYSLAVTGYPFRKAITRGTRVESDSALPYNCHAPAHVQKRPDYRQVALSIGGELCIPKPARVFGSLKRGHPSWRCQKHPCTNTAAFHFGSTRSGFPARPFV